MRKEDLDALKLAYQNAEVPKEGVENMKKLIAKGKKKNVTQLRTWVASVAAALALLVALPNVSMAAAEVLGNLPVVGGLFRVVTFRTWEYEADRFEAHVEVPQIIADTCPEAVSEINREVESLAREYVEQFEQAASTEESYAQLDIRSEIMANTENWFSLKVSIYQGAGSGYQQYRLYNIHKPTSRRVELGDVLTAEGLKIVTEEIKAQMAAQMAADSSVSYWLDSEIPEWNFTAVSENQQFYVTAAGDITLVFDEYEVAPGFMGAPEFTVSGSLLEGCLAEGMELR